MSQWNDEEYPSGSYSQHGQHSFSQSQAPYPSQFPGFNTSNTQYPIRSPNHSNLYLPNTQQDNASYTVESSQQPRYSPNHSPNTSFSNSQSFNSTLSIPPSSYTNPPRSQTFNFQAPPTRANGFDQTPSPNATLYSLPATNFDESRNQSSHPSHIAQQYYPIATNVHPQPSTKRPRQDGPFDEAADDTLESGKGDHKEKSKP